MTCDNADLELVGVLSKALLNAVLGNSMKKHPRQISGEQLLLFLFSLHYAVLCFVVSLWCPSVVMSTHASTILRCRIFNRDLPLLVSPLHVSTALVSPPLFSPHLFFPRLSTSSPSTTRPISSHLFCIVLFCFLPRAQDSSSEKHIDVRSEPQGQRYRYHTVPYRTEPNRTVLNTH